MIDETTFENQKKMYAILPVLEVLFQKCFH